MLPYDPWPMSRLWPAHPHDKRAPGMRIIEDVQTEPVLMEEAWWHLRVDDGGGPNDDWIARVGIPSARQWCERYTGLSIGRRTLEMSLQCFPRADIELPRGPVAAIASVMYADASGAMQTIDPALYELDVYRTPNALRAAYGTAWPAARDSANSVLIRYTAGFGLRGDPDMPLPPTIRSAMLLMLAHLFENREATAVTRATNLQEVPLGVKALLDFDRTRLGIA